MGKKNKRELIDWFPTEPVKQVSYAWQQRSHKNDILEMLAKPMNHQATGWLLERMVHLIHTADRASPYYSRESVIRSLRFVVLDFYYLESLMDRHTPVVVSRRDFFTLLDWVDLLESVGFELPRLRNRLIKLRLARDFS